MQTATVLEHLPVPAREPPASRESPPAVRLEIPQHVLRALILDGALHPADFRCLDCESKHCVRRLCLRACAEALAG